jgi:hypothetical protein
MRLIHYSNAPVKLDELIARGQHEQGDMKPKGLWMSDEDAELGWRQWCIEENFRLDMLTHVHEVTLGNAANVLILKTAAEVRDFGREFVIRHDPFAGGSVLGHHIMMLDCAGDPKLARHRHHTLSMVLSARKRHVLVLWLGLRRRMSLGPRRDQQRDPARDRRAATVARGNIMKSWRDRAAIRGGMSQLEFLAAMDREGFVVVPASLKQIALKFTTREQPGRTFEVQPGESFSRAYDRILRSSRSWTY